MPQPLPTSTSPKPANGSADEPVNGNTPLFASGVTVGPPCGLMPAGCVGVVGPSTVVGLVVVVDVLSTTLNVGVGTVSVVVDVVELGIVDELDVVVRALVVEVLVEWMVVDVVVVEVEVDASVVEASTAVDVVVVSGTVVVVDVVQQQDQVAAGAVWWSCNRKAVRPAVRSPVVQLLDPPPEFAPRSPDRTSRR